MIIEASQHPDYLSNTYLVCDRAGGEAVVIDAGGPAGPLFEAAERLSVTPSMVLLTHHHHDHVDALGEILARWPGTPVLISPLESDLVQGATATVDTGDRLTVGELQIGRCTRRVTRSGCSRSSSRTATGPPSSPATRSSAARWAAFAPPATRPTRRSRTRSWGR